VENENRLNMTDERTDEEFIAEVIRRGKQKPEEWKLEELIRLYDIPENELELVLAMEGREGLLTIGHYTRIEVRGCTNKLCDGKERKPCRLLQYIETCTKCLVRIGDVPNSAWE
jgi:hypothetical protein